MMAMASRPTLDSELLSLLACPKCKSDLTLSQDERGLICETCRVVFPIRNGVPVMLVEEGFPFQSPSQVQASRSDPVERTSGTKAVFAIVEGKNKGEVIELSRGTCRALGRSSDDIESTRIFSVDSVISLDESSKNLVMQYLTKQFQKGGSAPAAPKGREMLGGFLRDDDFQLRDAAVSRLHAMLFYHESGVVGILDLVSKNGTFVNGGEVESKNLKKGDLVTLGGTKVRFEG